MWKSVVAICVCASLGALLRWWFGAQLNHLFPTVPPGTLTANLVGGSAFKATAGWWPVRGRDSGRPREAGWRFRDGPDRCAGLQAPGRAPKSVRSPQPGRFAQDFSQICAEACLRQSEDRDVRRMMIGVNPIPPRLPRLEIVKQLPCISAGRSAPPRFR